jgi:hypothetical protein
MEEGKGICFSYFLLPLQLIFAIEFLFHTFALSQRGALKKRAEIIPNEPGTGNAV